MRVNNHQHIQFLHCLFHFRTSGLAVYSMTPQHMHANIVLLANVLFQNTIYPAGYRDTLVIHGMDRLAPIALNFLLRKLAFNPFGIQIPNAGPMPPSPIR